MILNIATVITGLKSLMTKVTTNTIGITELLYTMVTLDSD